MSLKNWTRGGVAVSMLALAVVSGCSLKSELTEDPGGTAPRNLGANKTSGGTGTGTSVGSATPKTDGELPRTEAHSGESVTDPGNAKTGTEATKGVPGTDTNSGQTSGSSSGTSPSPR